MVAPSLQHVGRWGRANGMRGSKVTSKIKPRHRHPIPSSLLRDDTTQDRVSIFFPHHHLHRNRFLNPPWRRPFATVRSDRDGCKGMRPFILYFAYVFSWPLVFEGGRRGYLLLCSVGLFILGGWCARVVPRSCNVGNLRQSRAVELYSTLAPWQRWRGGEGGGGEGKRGPGENTSTVRELIFQIQFLRCNWSYNFFCKIFGGWILLSE